MDLFLIVIFFSLDVLRDKLTNFINPTQKCNCLKVNHVSIIFLSLDKPGRFHNLPKHYICIYSKGTSNNLPDPSPTLTKTSISRLHVFMKHILSNLFIYMTLLASLQIDKRRRGKI